MELEKIERAKELVSRLEKLGFVQAQLHDDTKGLRHWTTVVLNNRWAFPESALADMAELARDAVDAEVERVKAEIEAL